jgi:hypothetical protein
MKYSWVDIPANTTRPRLARGTKRVFHRHQAGCIRKGIRVDGDIPPKDYMPCARCFVHGRGLSQACEDAR